MPSVRELVLFAHALHLARKAQAIDRLPLPDVIERLTRTPLLPRHVAPEHAHSAATRATARGARWFGWRDTCLVRALVLSALTRGDDCSVVIAFRKSDASRLEGHAWVRIGDRDLNVGEAPGDATWPGFETYPVRDR